MVSIAQMVVTIRRYGIVDRRVLWAVSQVDRKVFVPLRSQLLAYDDRALPIGFGQTISQPYTVARMCELLVDGSLFVVENAKVLEIGTGSGYQTAILAKLFNKVYSVEVIAESSRIADRNLIELGIKNYELRVGDGKKGWKEYVPYDGIIVTANAMAVPQELIAQLGEGGRIVIPVKGKMMRGTKLPTGQVEWESFGSFSFVSLV